MSIPLQDFITAQRIWENLKISERERCISRRLLPGSCVNMNLRGIKRKFYDGDNKYYCEDFEMLISVLLEKSKNKGEEK